MDLEDAMMELWLLKCRLKYRLTRKQKAALAGKVPMSKDLFWGCLDVCWNRFEMEKFWKIWNAYPEYVDAHHKEVKRDMADPDSPRRREAEAWWAHLRPKLAEAFGEEWVKEHCNE